MPLLKKRNPRYCRHRQSGQACVYLGSRQVLLGKFNSLESREAYDRVVADWLANHRQPAPEPGPPVTLASVLAQFWEHAQGFYRDKRELGSYRIIIRHLYRLYGDLPIEKFGPNALRAWREALIKTFDYKSAGGEAAIHEGWSRTYATPPSGF